MILNDDEEDEFAPLKTMRDEGTEDKFLVLGKESPSMILKRKKSTEGNEKSNSHRTTESLNKMIPSHYAPDTPD
jgi:hypothetical protein